MFNAPRARKAAMSVQPWRLGKACCAVFLAKACRLGRL
jgi:hypothetical protein